MPLLFELALVVREAYFGSSVCHLVCHHGCSAVCLGFWINQIGKESHMKECKGKEVRPYCQVSWVFAFTHLLFAYRVNIPRAFFMFQALCWHEGCENAEMIGL